MGKAIQNIKVYRNPLLLALLVLLPLLFGLVWLAAFVFLGFGSYWLINAGFSKINFKQDHFF